MGQQGDAGAGAGAGVEHLVAGAGISDGSESI